MLRWFFTDKCPNCGNRIASKAQFCGKCQWGNEKSWRNCTSCGRSVGADSSFCWNCSADLRTQAQGLVVSDRWRREPGVAAIRITIDTPEARLRNGVQVDEGTRAVFIKNGAIARDAAGPVEIGPGYHEITGFMQRLFGSGPTGSVQALVVTATPVEVRIDAGPSANIQSSDWIAAQAAALVKLTIEDLAAFHASFLSGGNDLVRDDELASLTLTARVAEVLRRFAIGRTSDQLLTDPDTRRAVEAELGGELPKLLQGTGLAFHSVVDVRFSGEALERKRQLQTGRASAQMEAAERELRQTMQMTADIGDLTREDMLTAEIERIAHDRNLTRLERDHLVTMRKEFMRREQRIAETDTDGRIRISQAEYDAEVERKRVQAEAERNRVRFQTQDEEERLRIQRKKQVDDNDLATLAVVREGQLAALERMKQIKAAAESASLEARARFAQSISGTDATAQVAAAGADMAPFVVAALRALNPLPQPVYMAPSAQAAVAAPSVAPGQKLEDIVPRYIPAVGLVLRQTADGKVEGVGTAWLAQGRGVLVTNAHVAEVVAPANGGGWVVFPGTAGQPYPIASVDLHPQYVRQTQGAGNGATVVTHDVAIIRLSTPPPHAGVPIAPKHKILALRDLQPVAYVGYPMRALAGGGTSLESPRPVAKSGTISALTDWLQRETPAAEAQLIRHDLGVTGGASGSPLWDGEGNVVGIICAMNIERIVNPNTRKLEVIPSAAMINFAQRIDVLTDWLGW